MHDIQIAPSILSADFGDLNAEIASIEEHVDIISVDVMDGHFVPNITVGAPVLKCLKSSLPFECHLMISEPEKYLEDFAKAGASIISVHYEATGPRTAEILGRIRELGCKASLAIKPATSPDEIREFLDLMDACVVMSVEPGFGGQSFMPESLPKITQLREWKSDLDIIVDGGINNETAPEAIAAGANILVSGSYIFKASDRVAAIASLKGS
ncbi:ribulose-phosphate 3-epimerase [Candidatus Peregrinibacteria bacterium]|jgi:ribulose-phosphate 3-epimerase|nr:ribulose-phosphate 3-epimerase [Candidatus Peregrinibacteria bacterium]MBT4631691.1 ribulose-phosphate 3-epimerase [Candidatus Peregrinibacteria bacterium]MBT5517218.1 ribulose-phosphate 3-epimerase [Candidatus Peregrinibacteria bacterium]MBT5824246.1 ribulose-phosphate 3-epimerase [Candidatus Peregrinibacteria bacterium]